MKVKEVASVLGVTVRTLHHYDEIGLLTPKKNKSSYRLYEKSDVDKLTEIIILRDLGFSLADIKNIITDSESNKQEALRIHRSLLQKKIEKLNFHLLSINKLIEGGEIDMSKYKDFDYNKYRKEAIDKYGEIAKQTHERVDKYSKEKVDSLKYETEKIFKKFASKMDIGFNNPDTMLLVKEWQYFITTNFYDCTNEILIGLADIYIEDSRFKKNIDKTKEGLSEFISKAIKHYVKVS